MAEELRLEATVVDRFSKPLTDLSSKLRGLRSADPGIGRLRRDFDQAQASMNRMTETLGSFQTGLGMISARVTGLIGGFIAITNAVRSFTSEVPRISQLSRETGVATNNLRALVAVGEKLQIQGVEGGVSKFAENMYELMRNRGTMWVELNKSAPQLAQQLRQSKNIEEALSIAIDAVAKIREEKGPIAAQRFSETMFGTKEFARFGELTREQRKQEIDAARERTKLSKEQEERAEALRAKLLELNEAYKNLSDTAISEFAPALIEVSKALEKLIASGSGFKETIAVPFKMFSDSVEAVQKLLNGDVKGGARSFLKTAPLADYLLRQYERSQNPESRLDILKQRRAEMDGMLAQEGGDSRLRDRMLKNRALLDEEIRRLEKAVKEGVKDGIKESTQSPGAQKTGFQNAAFTPGGGGGFGGGGANGVAPHWQPVPNGDGAGGSGGGRAGPFVPGAPASGVSPPGSLTNLINAEAERAGIDPAIMHGIRAGESNRNNKYDVKDDRIESSWGPFQLNRRRGLGVLFEKETAEERKALGIGDLRDPRTIPLQARWVAEYLKKKGPPALRNWSGYRGPRRPDPRWGNSGYVPAPASGASQGGGEASPFGDLKGIGAGTFIQPGSLAAAARGAGLLQLTSPPPSGKAQLDVTLNGFPAGWKARAEGGGLFNDVNISRGRSMVAATEE